jgi:hypothetical protein
LVKYVNLSVWAAYDKCFGIVELFASIREKVEASKSLVFGFFSKVERVVHYCEDLGVGQAYKRLIPEGFDAQIEFSELVCGMEKGAMIFTDVAKLDTLDVNAHAPEAAPTGAMRLMVYLYRKL